MLNPVGPYVCSLGYREFIFCSLISLDIIFTLTNYSWGDRVNRILRIGVFYDSEENLNVINSRVKGLFSWIYVLHGSLIPARDNFFFFIRKAYRDYHTAMDPVISHPEKFALPYVLLWNYSIGNYGSKPHLLW